MQNVGIHWFYESMCYATITEKDMSRRSRTIIHARMNATPLVRSRGFAEVRRRWPDSPDLRAVAKQRIPDAYEFHEGISRLVSIGPVDTHPLRCAKEQAMTNLHGKFEDEDWDLTVAGYDNCGDMLEKKASGWRFDRLYPCLRIAKAAEVSAMLSGVRNEIEIATEPARQELLDTVIRIGS